jgi:hypothetical protein
LLAILVAFLEEIETIIDNVVAEGGDSRQQVLLLIEDVFSQPAEQRAVIGISSQEMAQLSVPARATFNHAYHEKFIKFLPGAHGRCAAARKRGRSIGLFFSGWDGV